MMIQIETVDHRSEPDDYLDAERVARETISWESGGTPRGKEIKVVHADSLEALIGDIDHSCIVHDAKDHYRAHEDAEWVVRVYDGYNE